MIDIEFAVASRIISHGEIPTSDVKQMLNSKSRIILTKGNFPNIRQYLHSYMTAYHTAPYRGGYSWVCVIGAKDKEALKQFLANKAKHKE